MLNGLLDKHDLEMLIGFLRAKKEELGALQ
jgi:hypothetical protein